jgi:hypothetical protein
MLVSTGSVSWESRSAACCRRAFAGRHAWSRGGAAKRTHPPQELNGTAPQGISQSGFALIKGKKYIGRIWLRATSGAKVNVALV